MSANTRTSVSPINSLAILTVIALLSIVVVLSLLWIYEHRLRSLDIDNQEQMSWLCEDVCVPTVGRA